MLGHWGLVWGLAGVPGDTEHLWRNDSDNTRIRFTSVSEASGIAPSIVVNRDPLVTSRTFDNTFTPTFARINDDALPDILVVADFNSTLVFINNGDGTFSNVTDYDVIIDGNGMGSAVGDFDGDGDLDWFVSSIRAVGEDVPSHLSRVGNRLYRNDDGTFADVTADAGVTDGGWGLGKLFPGLRKRRRPGHLSHQRLAGVGRVRRVQHRYVEGLCLQRRRHVHRARGGTRTQRRRAGPRHRLR